jgi:transcriptional regulator with XRE-family HTH domain
MASGKVSCYAIRNKEGTLTKILAPTLKELRLRKRESLQELADAVKASKAHIWELETGKSRNPSMELIRKLADHFGVAVATLIGEDPESSQEDSELVAMFRDLKSVTDSDRELLKAMLETMKRRRTTTE